MIHNITQNLSSHYNTHASRTVIFVIIFIVHQFRTFSCLHLIEELGLGLESEIDLKIGLELRWDGPSSLHWLCVCVCVCVCMYVCVCVCVCGVRESTTKSVFTSYFLNFLHTHKHTHRTRRVWRKPIDGLIES